MTRGVNTWETTLNKKIISNQKLLLVLVIFTVIIDIDEEATFEPLLYIQYLLLLYKKNNKDKNKNVTILISLSSKIYIKHLFILKNWALILKKLILVYKKLIDTTYILLK